MSPTSAKPVSVCSVVVCYFPDLNSLSHLLGVLSKQTDQIVVVDNSAYSIDVGQLCSQHGVEYLPQKDNVGVASGLNVGIEFALIGGFDFIATFDQDSVPSVGMIASLLHSFESQASIGSKVAAVGPNLRDPRTGDLSGFVYKDGLFLLRDESAFPVVSVDLLITSGMLLSAAAIRQVGLMRDELFIDGVDNEWCLRAKMAGYELFGVKEVYLEHCLGEDPVIFRGNTHSIHKPFRYYYIVRNGLWLAKQNWLPRDWRLEEFIRVFKGLIIYSLFLGSRRENTKMMLLGLYHALRGKMGPLK